MTNSLKALRSAFRRCKVGAHRDIGLRAIKDALALEGRNPAREAELLARAEYHLPHAEAAR